jgi:hypothetical protein
MSSGKAFVCLCANVCTRIYTLTLTHTTVCNHIQTFVSVGTPVVYRKSTVSVRILTVSIGTLTVSMGILTVSMGSPGSMRTLTVSMGILTVSMGFLTVS